jgi:hypothetical protein
MTTSNMGSCVVSRLAVTPKQSVAGATSITSVGSAMETQSSRYVPGATSSRSVGQRVPLKTAGYGVAKLITMDMERTGEGSPIAWFTSCIEGQYHAACSSIICVGYEAALTRATLSQLLQGPIRHEGSTVTPSGPCVETDCMTLVNPDPGTSTRMVEEPAWPVSGSVTDELMLAGEGRMQRRGEKW